MSHSSTFTNTQRRLTGAKMSENNDREVVYRIDSGVYHVPRWDGHPGCNTHDVDISENEIWATAMESEMDDRLYCSRCEAMGTRGRTRRELIKDIREELPPVEDPPHASLNPEELAIIKKHLTGGDCDG